MTRSIDSDPIDPLRSVRAAWAARAAFPCAGRATGLRAARRTAGTRRDIVRGTRLSRTRKHPRTRSPVLAFALEPAPQINVRKDRLRAWGLAPGPWLGALKRHLQAGERAAAVTLPDGRVESTATLAAELVLVSPGKKLVYATDFSDSVENRRRLIALASGAHTLFCEATFVEADAAQAARTAHLTTRACAEIAAAAGVARLVPFHFSRRYEQDPARIYEEIATICPALAMPKSLAVFGTNEDTLD